MAGSKPSLVSIANRLGISSMAVSLALRGRPGVSESLRGRVLACARELGYEPNGAVNELMSMIRARRSVKASGDLVAFVTSFGDPKLLDRVHTFHAFFEGAARRAQKYGYEVEAFHARAPGMNPLRLTQILKARGVRGVILGPRWHDEPELELDWSVFSVVLVGEVFHRPGIYRTCNHHVQSCCLALRRLTDLGYRRIAALFPRHFESSRGYEYMLGVDQFHRETSNRHPVATWQYDTWDAPGFTAWVMDQKIDAVVCYADPAWRTALTLKTPSGESLGCANLDVPPGSGWSGINQHSEAIGETTMDLLRQLLLTGERGTSIHPQIVLIDGTWVDGTTTRPPARS